MFKKFVVAAVAVGVGVGEEKRAGPPCPPRSNPGQSCQDRRAARLPGLQLSASIETKPNEPRTLTNHPS